MIKAVLFDLDDTLYSEKEYVYSGFYAVAKEISANRREKTEEYFSFLTQSYEQSSESVFDRFIEATPDLNVTISDLLHLYHMHLPKISLYKDVLPCLKLMKGLQLKLGLITDGRSIQQRLKIEALDLDFWFDYIIVTDELGGLEYRKPNPFAFKKMCEYFDVDLSEAVYIGDNPKKDFVIRNYGMKTVRIVRKDNLYQNEPYLNGITAQFTIESLAQLLQLEIFRK